MIISGNTAHIAPIGFLTHARKTSMFYNPWLERKEVRARRAGLVKRAGFWRAA